MTIEFYDPIPQPQTVQDKPKRGRPPKNESDKHIRLVTYMHPSIGNSLREESVTRGIPVSEIIREMLEDRYSQG